MAALVGVDVDVAAACSRYLLHSHRRMSTCGAMHNTMRASVHTCGLVFGPNIFLLQKATRTKLT